MYLFKLSFFVFLYVGRERNKVADSLANYGLNVQNDLYWVEDNPDFVFEHITNDVSYINE